MLMSIYLASIGVLCGIHLRLEHLFLVNYFIKIQLVSLLVLLLFVL